MDRPELTDDSAISPCITGVIAHGTRTLRGASLSNCCYPAAKHGMSRCRRHLALCSTATKRNNPATAVNTSRMLRSLLHEPWLKDRASPSPQMLPVDFSAPQRRSLLLRGLISLLVMIRGVTGVQKRPERIRQDLGASSQASTPPASCALELKLGIAEPCRRGYPRTHCLPTVESSGDRRPNGRGRATWMTQVQAISRLGLARRQ